MRDQRPRSQTPTSAEPIDLLGATADAQLRAFAAALGRAAARQLFGEAIAADRATPRASTSDARAERGT
jgi:hypothetical protein